ncbi:MAG: site-2 protease family protein [Chloroflexi bacterium]|nr:site-2 protease family protein [Chloroflexota bacterium]
MLVAIAGIISAVTVHEAGHAWSALQLGDPTAARQGRVSLNPLRHLDPAGSFLFLLVGFGWGKPTPVNPAYMRGNPVTGMAVTSFAGPGVNLLAASLFALPIRLGPLPWNPPLRTIPLLGASPQEALADVFAYAILFNILLAAFNLIPLPPLDGFKVALGVLPREAARGLARIERFGPTPLILLILLDFILPFRIISSVLEPAVNFLGLVIVGEPLR